MDEAAPSLHGRPVLPVLVPLSRILHYAGFGLAIGALLAATLARHASRRRAGAERRGLEAFVPDLVAKVEIPGLFVALSGGVLAVGISPAQLEPGGPAGPWLFIKLPLVMALVAIAHVRMWGARALVRARDAGDGEEECAEIGRKGERLDAIAIFLVFAILVIATFRYSLFG